LKEIIFIGVMIVLTYLYWPVEKSRVEETSSGNIVFHFRDAEAQFTPQASLDAIYMVFGMETDPSIFADGYARCGGIFFNGGTDGLIPNPFRQKA
jgi:protein-L-isoaspartate O-methyltransferase